MSNLRTGADIVDAVLNRCGELTDGTSTYDSDGTVIRHVNSVYRAVLAGGSEFGLDAGEPWIWAQASAPQLLTLKAPYDTGTISLTQNSTSGTFSSAPSSSLAGWYIRLDAGKDWYQISAHTGASTSFTLDQAFIETTASGSFRAVKTDYQLSTAVTRLVAPVIVYRDNIRVGGSPERGQIFEIDANTMLRRYPRMLIEESVPDKYAVIGQSNADVLTLRFNSYPAEDMRAEVPYIAVASDLTDSSGSTPLIPYGFREILVHGASYFLMLDKSDNRADTEYQLAKAKLQALVNHNRKSLSLAGNSYFRMAPRSQSRQRFRSIS